MEERFNEDHGEGDTDEASKTQGVRHALDKRRILDDALEQRRLRRELRDYDFDLDD